MEITNTPKNPKIFCCDVCNFNCSNKKDYSRHLTTAKHKWKLDGNLGNKKTDIYKCTICNKNFKTNSGLWKHKQKCNTNLINMVISSENESIEIDKRDELIERLFTSNTEMVSSSNEMKSMIHLLLEKYQESQIQIQESQLQNQESQLQYQKSQLQNQE